MARKTVKPINFEPAIAEILNKYGEAVYDVLSESIDEVAGDAVDKLKSVSSFAPRGHPSGQYSASWASETVTKKRVYTKKVVHNEEHYRLTHLLEKGHVNRNGTGRSYGRTPAYPHIAPVNEWANQELPKVVEGKLKRI